MNPLKFSVRILTSLLLFTIYSCSTSDPITETTEGNNTSGKPDTPTQTYDYSEFRQFLSERINANDYCLSFSATTSEFKVKCMSQLSFTAKRGNIPYLTIANNGTWIANGASLSMTAGSNITHSAPAVSTSAAGMLMIDGTSLNIKAGESILCIINARKHIYICFPNQTLTLPSEIYTTYNPELPSNPQQLNILFIGNSFTQDATEHLPAMLTASGINNVNMTRVYHGGFTLPEYYANFNTPKTCAIRHSNPGSTSWDSNETQDDTPADALAERTWDVVVLQEHTGRSEAWYWPGTMQGAITGLVNTINSAQQKRRPTIIYLLAQTYSNGSSVLTTSFSNDRTKMFTQTSSVVKQMMDETGIDRVISTAAVLENLRTSSLNNSLQLTRDSYHMDYGISRYAAACAVFETIITPTLGNKISDCPYRFSTSNTTSGSYTTPVTDSNAPVAQKAAHEAIANPFKVTDLSNL